MSSQLQRMGTGYRITQALYVVAKLGVADLLTDRPKDAGELAKRLGVQPVPLFRVMRAVAGYGVFTQDASDRFGLAPLGAALRSDDPLSVRGSIIMHGELHYRAAGELLHTVRTGETAFNHLYGKGLFEYLAGHPEASAVFNAAMADTAALWAEAVRSVDLRGRKLLVDVGGGSGRLMAELLQQNPHQRGILFDLPAGVVEAPGILRSHGVADRCEIRTGDAFESIPAGGDVYIFSRVLHDWPDPEARRLLSNARKAIADGGLLLLWEGVVPEGATPSPSKELDLSMLFLLGGAERTEAQWRAMLTSTGFELTKVTRTGTAFDVIEAHPV